jgi:hypothetical protein
MILKKPNRAQYFDLFGPIASQVKAVLALAFEDDGSLMFANEETASYRKFCDIVEQLKKEADEDVNKGEFVTKGLAIIDIYVREVDELFSIKDQDERFNKLQTIVRGKLRINGQPLTDEQYENLAYVDQVIAVNKTLKDITGDEKNPLAESVKE